MKKVFSSTRNLIKTTTWTPLIQHSRTITKEVGSSSTFYQHDAIPTPKRLPILGTTLDIIASGSAKGFHEYINKRHRELGPIFRENIGPMECVFLSSPEMMRELFLYEGKYPRHPIPEAWLLYQQDYNNKRGLLFMDGEDWLYHRKLMNTILLSRDVESMNEPIESASQDVISMWRERIKNGEDIIMNVEKDLYKWSIQTVINLFLGSSHKQKDIELQEMIDQFSNEVHKIFKYSAKMFIAPPKLLKLLKLKVWTEFEEAVTQTMKLGQEITDHCMNTRRLTDGFLVEMEKAKISQDYINRIFIDMIIAAGDTTAFSTLWALYLLANNPDFQKDIRQILKEDPTNKESTLMKGIVKETLRMYPVAPFIGRILPEDSIIGNYKINKNTMVLLSLFTSGRDEANFQNPNTFCPVRWDRKSISFSQTIKPQASMPFAMGSRSCIGQRIATKQMHLFLSNVIANFEFNLAENKDVKPILQMITVPNQPIHLKLKLTT